MALSHDIRIITNGAEISGWSGYHVESSMLTPSNSFELRRPFDLQAWNLLRRDSDVSIQIDKTPILRGFVGRRHRMAREGTMIISGRSRSGRLVDEAAPSVNFSGMSILQAFQRLGRPWFSQFALSDAADRRVRVGKGKRVAGGKEPAITINIRVPKRGIVHPGQKRSEVMHEIAGRAGLIWWASSEGDSIYIGKPNHEQDPQYLFRHIKEGSTATNTVKDLEIIEDDEDRYSLIMVGGTGGATPDDYGSNVTDRRGVVYDNPLSKRGDGTDGTGRDFIHPKRMFMPERDFDSYADAQRVARNEQIRRDYKRHIVQVEMELHGQSLSPGSPPTLFTYNTVARVIDEEVEIDDTYLIVDCAYSSNREQGETTTMHMVPTGTEILL